MKKSEINISLTVSEAASIVLLLSEALKTGNLIHLQMEHLHLDVQGIAKDGKNIAEKLVPFIKTTIRE